MDDDTYLFVLYSLLGIVVIIIFIYGYIRLKYGFWYYQPVFHAYDFYYYLFPCGIINKELPSENKYTNFKQIITYKYEDLSSIQLNKFTNFIQTHFLQKKGNKFSPKRENITPYFTGHNRHPCFFSFFNIKNILHNVSDNTFIEDQKIIAVMTSRPVKIKIYKKENNNSNFSAYYVDYLCVDMDYRKKGTAPQIIQTHEYRQRHLNKNIVVSLFKREGQLTGIVPLCVYDTYCFSSAKWGKPNKMHPIYSIVECNSQNISILYSFIKLTLHNIFDISIMTDISNWLDLIKSGNIYVYFLLCEKEIISTYFFRNTCVELENKNILTCFASIKNCDENLFIYGFKNSCWTILNKFKQYGFVVVENIGHNSIIVKNLLKKSKPIVISPTAYFFYNFAYHTFNSEKVFVIC